MTICGAAAGESFAAGSAFLVPEAAPSVASVKGSNVVNGSWCAVGSGFPRRRRGRFGSAIGSSASEADADAGAFAGSPGAGALAAAVLAVFDGAGVGVGVLPGAAVVGDGAAEAAGFC